jgi:hypothetical protein
MASVKEIVHVLDLLTTPGPEALAPEIAQPALQLRKIIGSRNTVGVGVGEKITNGKGTGTLALRFYVKRKLSLRKLKAVDAIPPAVHPALTETEAAVQTDVIVLGPIRLDGKAIKPGDSLGHFKVTAGTFGALVRHNQQLEVLSNSHVLARSGKARRGDPILSPAKADGGKSPMDVVARLSRFKKFVTGGAFVNVADCAVVKPVATRLDDFRSNIPGVGVPRGTIAPKRGMKIVKVGRTTGKTVGVVHDIHFRVVFPYEGVGRVGFLDQVLCSRYSAPGDSGSLVLDRRTKRAVGLHFASATEGSVFSPIGNVLEALGVTLVTTDID